jgi:hypothetical protein
MRFSTATDMITAGGGYGFVPVHDVDVFSFGLLSFSHTYAIHSFGLTVLLGVIFSFIYATLFTSSDAKHVVVQQYQPKS